MTCEAVLEYVVEKGKLDSNTAWGLFEVVCDDLLGKNLTHSAPRSFFVNKAACIADLASHKLNQVTHRTDAVLHKLPKGDKLAKLARIK